MNPPHVLARDEGSAAPSPAVAPPPGNPRFALFDGLRALAATGVLVAHAGYLSGAIVFAFYGPLVANLNVGVTLFFVVSGFLLYRPFVVRRMARRPPPSLRAYTRRRLLRIVPAYWVALTVLAIYPGLPGVFTGDWWKYYLFLQVYTGGHDVVGGLAAAWSLCVEMSFYLVLPAYALGVRRLARGRDADGAVRRELILLGLLALASIALRAADLATGSSALQLTLLTTFAWFALGMGLAVLSAAEAASGVRGRLAGLVRRSPAACWLIALVFYVVLSLVLQTPPGELSYTSAQWMVYHVMSSVIAVCLVLPAVFAGDGAGLVQRFLRVRWLAALGVVSYGIYLWQGGTVEVLCRAGVTEWLPSSRFMVLAGLTMLLTVVIAIVSYFVVERPFLRRKERVTPPAGVR